MITSSTASTHDSSKRDQLVVLVHGIASKRFWMLFLMWALQRRGYSTRNWGYPSLSGSLDRHARRLRTLLEESTRLGNEVHLVGHSMGAIISRLALSYGPLPGLGRVVLIAPPNHGSPVAKLLSFVLRGLCPVLGELSNRSESNVNQIGPVHGVSVGIIGARFDLLVPLASTLLDGQTDHICLTATHNSLLFQQRTVRNVDAFLSTGRFSHSN
ncbi:MAG: alpha/beta fold hydrolase, partial [Pirellulaceae bacterium]|jgi:pimeloyl-ACP methyl ester carboxylesterase|nr:alpha/beta fold hydrolase [Planctomycetaceae bacterium]